jgi:hypothetical protein
MATADAFEKLPGGADKAALAQQLFGRQSKDLLPLLNQGSDGLEKQMKIMEKHGLTLDKEGVQKGLELAKAQREMKAATDGLKTSIGQALLPVLVAAADALKPLISGFSWAMQNIPGFSYAVIGVAGVLGGLMIAVVVAGALGVLAGALGITTGALLGLIGAALLAAAPFIAIGLAIAALIAGLVIAYKKVGWFRDAVDAAFGAVKTAVSAAVGFVVGKVKSIGPALLLTLGPIGAVAFAFIKWKSQIADVVNTIISTIKKIPEAAQDVANKVKSAISDIGGGIGGIGGKIGGLASKIIPGQHGLVMPMGGGLALVGEAGPELLQLPGGARVTPLQDGTAPGVDLGRAGGDIHVHLDVDGRELAHVVASEAQTQQARR